MAVYLEEPWKSVRKVVLFDHDYRRIFNRTLSGHKLYLIELIAEAVKAERKRLRPEIESSFASVQLSVAYLLAKLLQMSDNGRELLEQAPRALAPGPSRSST